MRAMELTEDYPSKIARQLIQDEVDLALVPVAIIPRMKDYHIIGDYCIGSDGPVASVALFSETPVSSIARIYLDYQSMSSVALLKILLGSYWKIHPLLSGTTGEFTDLIRGKDAGLMIGDRALAQRLQSTYIFDLGEAWKDFTGLPFVYAAWISNKILPDDFIRDFNEACAIGIANIPGVIRENPSPLIDLNLYYTRHISFSLTPEKRKGLALFLTKLAEMG